MLETTAFLVLRIVLAWMFLYPLKALLSDWKASVNVVSLIAPFQPQLFAVLMIVVMIVGSISVLFGIYAQIGALLLFIYSLLGVVVHYKLAAMASGLKLTASAGKSDQAVLEQAKGLAGVGNVTSAQKNNVIAAAFWVIICLGSGPYSLTGNLF